MSPCRSAAPSQGCPPIQWLTCFPVTLPPRIFAPSGSQDPTGRSAGPGGPASLAGAGWHSRLGLLVYRAERVSQDAEDFLGLGGGQVHRRGAPAAVCVD